MELARMAGNRHKLSKEGMGFLRVDAVVGYFSCQAGFTLEEKACIKTSSKKGPPIIFPQISKIFLIILAACKNNH